MTASSPLKKVITYIKLMIASSPLKKQLFTDETQYKLTANKQQ
jgi:hypothetical protein